MKAILICTFLFLLEIVFTVYSHRDLIGEYGLIIGIEGNITESDLLFIAAVSFFVSTILALVATLAINNIKLLGQYKRTRISLYVVLVFASFLFGSYLFFDHVKFMYGNTW